MWKVVASGPVQTQLPGLSFYQSPIRPVRSVNNRSEGLQSRHEGNFLGHFVEKLVLVIKEPAVGLSPRAGNHVLETHVLYQGRRQQVQGVPLHVVELTRCEEVVVEEQHGLLAHHLQSRAGGSTDCLTGERRYLRGARIK